MKTAEEEKVSDRKSYGPNPRLVLKPHSGEIVTSGRDLIRIHGGRQEDYDEETKTWTAQTQPVLKMTKGCLRAYDSDMAELVRVVNDLEVNDAEEERGFVTVVDSLERVEVPAEIPFRSRIEFKRPALPFWEDTPGDLMEKPFRILPGGPSASALEIPPLGRAFSMRPPLREVTAE